MEYARPKSALGVWNGAGTRGYKRWYENRTEQYAIVRLILGVWAHIGTSTLKQAYLGGIKSVRAQILRLGSS